MKPKIAVIGVGGAGGNAVNNMIASGLTGAQFMVANTDAQALAASSAEHRIQLGVTLTEGLGAGSKPEIGEAAAEEAVEEIRAAVTGCHMVFVAAGMGGGTGTGAASVIARVAKELGILTIAVVTKPFHFEGSRRMKVAEMGIAELRRHVDTLIVIPNQNLFNIASERTTFAEAFVAADQVLYSGICCIVDLIVKDGLINLDLADVKAVLLGMGTAMMGTGEASGEQRAIVAAEEAIVNPLLDDVTLKGARSLLLSISGGRDMTLLEVEQVANTVRAEVDPDANIIVGATIDEALGDKMRVSIVASGMGRAAQATNPEIWASRARQGGFGANVPEDYRDRLSAAIRDGGAGPGGGSHAAHDHGEAGDVYITEGPPTLSNRAANHAMQGPGPVADTAQRDWHVPPTERFPQSGREPPPLPYSQRQPDLPESMTSRLWGFVNAARGKSRKATDRLPRHSRDDSGRAQDREQAELPGFLGRTKR
jgi:cell division protein FtsZ